MTWQQALEIIREAGHTHQQIADRLGVYIASVSFWRGHLRGKAVKHGYQPTIEHQAALCRWAQDILIDGWERVVFPTGHKARVPLRRLPETGPCPIDPAKVNARRRELRLSCSDVMRQLRDRRGEKPGVTRQRTWKQWSLLVRPGWPPPDFDDFLALACALQCEDDPTVLQPEEHEMAEWQRRESAEIAMMAERTSRAPVIGDEDGVPKVIAPEQVEALLGGLQAAPQG